MISTIYLSPLILALVILGALYVSICDEYPIYHRIYILLLGICMLIGLWGLFL